MWRPIYFISSFYEENEEFADITYLIKQAVEKSKIQMVLQ